MKNFVWLIAVVVALTFTILKLVGATTLSWWFLFAPLIAYFSMVIFALLIAFALGMYTFRKVKKQEKEISKAFDDLIDTLERRTK